MHDCEIRHSISHCDTSTCGVVIVTSFTTSDGVRLDYAVDDFSDPWKRSETIVLLHSAMGCKQRFFAWMPILSRHFKVVRLDLRGHGASEVPSADKTLDIDRLVGDILEFLKEVGVEHGHFVGASAGGYLSMRIAMDMPEKVDSLSLFGSTPGFKGGQAQHWLPRIRQEGLRSFLADTISDRLPEDVDPELRNWFLDQAGGNDVDYITRFIGLMDQQDWSDEVSKIRCPTLLVIPGLGKIGDYSRFDVMREQIDDITIKTYEGMPHNVWDAVPERCADDVRAFVEEVAARRSAASDAA
nr:alpha/beta hydrolase [Afifella sp. IM 167]